MVEQIENRRPQAEEIPEYLEQTNAEELRKALDVKDSAMGWNTILQEVNRRSDVAEASPLKNRLTVLGLQKKRSDVEQKRQDVSFALLATLKLVKAGMPVMLHRELVFRSLARYLDEKQTYEKIWKGEVPGEINLPEYLTPYIRSKESGHMLIRATEIILPTQYDVQEKAKLNSTPRQLSSLSNVLLLGAVNRRVSLRYVLACVPNGTLSNDIEPYRAFLAVSGFQTNEGQDISPQELEATKFAVAYIAKYLDAVQTTAKLKGTKVEDMTVTDAIEASLSAHPLAEMTKEIMSHVSEISLWSVPDLREAAKKALENKNLYPDQLVQAALAPLGNLPEAANPTDRAEFEANASAVGKFFMGFDAERFAVKHVEEQIKPYNEKQKAMIRSLCEQVKSEKVTNQILRSLFVPEQEKDRKQLDKDATAQLQALIQNGELTLKETFQLYYLSNSKSGAGLPLAYSAIQILDKHGQSTLSFDLQARSLRSLAGLTLTGVSNLPKKLESFGFDESQAVEFRNGILALKESGFEHGANALLKLWSLLKNHWDILAAAGIIPAGISAWQLKVFIDGKRFRKFAFGGTEQVRQEFKLQGVTDDQIRILQKEMQEILAERDLLWKFNFPERFGLTGQAHTTLKAASQDVEGMAKMLHKRYGTAFDVAQKMREANITDDEIRHSLKGLGYDELKADEAIERIGKNTRAELAGLRSNIENLNVKRFEDMADQLNKRLDAIEAPDGPKGPKLAEARAKIVEDVRVFQRELNDLSRVQGNEEVRKAVIRRLFPDITEANMKTILRAHTTDGLQFKLDLLKRHLSPQRARRLIRLGIAGETPSAEVVKQASRGLRWGHITNGGFAVLDAVFVSDDLYKYGEEIDNDQRIRESLHRTLTEHGFTFDAKKDAFVKGPIVLQVEKDVLNKLSAKKDIAAGRVAIDVAAGAGSLSLLLVESGVAAPLGALLAAGVLTVHVYLDKKERAVAYKFIQESEPWLLAYMGTGATVGSDEYDLLRKGTFENEQPLEVRKRSLFALFMQRVSNKELNQELTQNNLSPETLNQFYEEDFQKMVLPFFSAALFANLQQYTSEPTLMNVTWQQVRDLNIQNNWLQVPDAMPHEVETALDQSAVFYVQHLREQRYLQGRELMAQAVHDGDRELAKDLDKAMQEAGSKRVFGTTLYSVDSELQENQRLMKEQGRMRQGEPSQTRAQIILQKLLSQFDAPVDRSGNKRTSHSLSSMLHEPDAFAVRLEADSKWWAGDHFVPSAGFDLKNLSTTLEKQENVDLFGESVIKEDTRTKERRKETGKSGSILELIEGRKAA